MTVRDLIMLKSFIWHTDRVRVENIYAVLDCARHASVYEIITRSYRKKACLFSGNLQTEVERSSPFLLELGERDGVTNDFLRHGWTEAWGIIIRTSESFDDCRRHLRTLLRVRTEDGRFLLFRYYDPRVLGIYLPTCTAEELRLVFGSGRSTWLLSSQEANETRAFSLSDVGTLQVSALALEHRD